MPVKGKTQVHSLVTIWCLRYNCTTNELASCREDVEAGTEREGFEKAAKAVVASVIINIRGASLLAAIVKVASDAGWLSVAKEFELPSVLAIPVTTVYKATTDAYAAADLSYSMQPALVPAHFFVATVVTVLALAVLWFLYV